MVHGSVKTAWKVNILSRCTESITGRALAVKGGAPGSELGAPWYVQDKGEGKAWISDNIVERPRYQRSISRSGNNSRGGGWQYVEIGGFGRLGSRGGVTRHSET